MKTILLLSNNNNAVTLFDRLREKGYEVILHHDPVTVTLIDELKPDLMISYNYRFIIKEDVIRLLGNRIINMHTSLFPWNKGASPNIWSFIEDTPKGVTIHVLDKGLDTGKIIFQKELFFDEKQETLLTTYEKLNKEIVDLLMDNWSTIESLNYPQREQEGEGSYHNTSDLEKLLHGEQIDYTMTIAEFKEFIKSL